MDMVDAGSKVIIRQLECAAVGRTLQRNQPNPSLREAIISSIIDIRKKMLNYGGGNEKAGVLKTGKPLERHADHFIILNYGAAAIAWIYGGVGLRRQISAITDVGVRLQF